MTIRNIVVGITGASGGPYAVRLLDCLDAAGVTVHLVVSSYGQRLLADECGIRNLDAQSLLGRPSTRLKLHHYRDLGGPLASGSFLTEGMVICPCSSNTLGSVASGLGDNLISRAAQVTLKEARRLIIVHREMPLSHIDLSNMLRLQAAGAIICPANPGFYMAPKTIGDLVDFVVGRVLDLLHVPHTLNVRWS
ncbi:MAG TPA: UbiX family flavin prenyltransferase [Phycisphaerae bacterium]|nr:UbiX family flavin prenyltransferase [Phycisphaerae bacterium]HOJ75806.1 UbiX family flavin prenyltransferase [Phycisphaerae bacterium]HOM53192.1 UbiX family flavin prenyltransferase [Phycisphaerae bacterium]HON67097.1 UbiX family flavin prenyltransferase [Phycisphaerae bacterium]HOQ88393.1 UbiX family flavin prenyltransferase [Phycisphaerae bacterium]